MINFVYDEVPVKSLKRGDEFSNGEQWVLVNAVIELPNGRVQLNGENYSAEETVSVRQKI